uniref:Multidrug and toxin extrusion protein n=1 Tax=Tetraodon nigroviridis TaxID=99883 RepID=H3CJD8_TETNG
GLLCRRLPPVYREQLCHTLKLTGPLTISDLLIISISFVNTLFCGYIGSTQLAGYALATAAINVTAVAIGRGIVRACDTLVSQVYGSQNTKLVGVIVQRSLLISLLFCLPCWALLLNFSNIMLFLHQEHEVVRIASIYVVAYMPAIPAMLLRELLACYLRNQQGITLPQLYCTAATNVFNLISNYVLIFSLHLGGTGSAITNCLCEFFSCLLLFGYIRWRKLHLKTWDGWSMQCLQGWGSYMKLAVPSTLVICFDIWIFEIIAVMAGALGESVLAAQYVIIQIGLVIFTIPHSISEAASVCVGNALGAGDAHRAVVSTRVSLVLTGMFGVVYGLILAVVRTHVGFLFTSNLDTVAIITQILTLNIFSGFFDTVLCVSTGICVGAALQKIVALANLICYYVFSLPVGAALMFATDLGLMGLWIGLCTGFFLESVFFVGLFHRVNWKKLAEKAQKRSRVPGEVVSPTSAAQSDGIVPESDCQNTELKVDHEDEGSNSKANPSVRDAEQSNVANSRPKAPLSINQLILQRGLAAFIAVLLFAIGVAFHFAFPVP